MQEPQPLGRYLPAEKVEACGVAAGPGKAGDKTKLDWVLGDAENDRDRRRCRFGRARSRSAGGRGDQRHAATDQIGHQRWQLIVSSFQPVVLDRHVLAVDKTGFVEAFAAIEDLSTAMVQPRSRYRNLSRPIGSAHLGFSSPLPSTSRSSGGGPRPSRQRCGPCPRASWGRSTCHREICTVCDRGWPSCGNSVAETACNGRCFGSVEASFTPWLCLKGTLTVSGFKGLALGRCASGSPVLQMR